MIEPVEGVAGVEGFLAAVVNAAFDCGEWDDTLPEEYQALTQRSKEANRALLSHIVQREAAVRRAVIADLEHAVGDEANISTDDAIWKLILRYRQQAPEPGKERDE